MHDMIVHAGINENLKTDIWPECAATSKKLENIMVNPQEEKCAHKKFYIKIPDYAKYLNNLGEMVVVPSIYYVK